MRSRCPLTASGNEPMPPRARRPWTRKSTRDVEHRRGACARSRQTDGVRRSCALVRRSRRRLLAQGLDGTWPRGPAGKRRKPRISALSEDRDHDRATSQTGALEIASHRRRARGRAAARPARCRGRGTRPLRRQAGDARRDGQARRPARQRRPRRDRGARRRRPDDRPRRGRSRLPRRRARPRRVRDEAGAVIGFAARSARLLLRATPSRAIRRSLGLLEVSVMLAIGLLGVLVATFAAASIPVPQQARRWPRSAARSMGRRRTGSPHRPIWPRNSRPTSRGQLIIPSDARWSMVRPCGPDPQECRECGADEFGQCPLTFLSIHSGVSVVGERDPAAAGRCS